MGQHFLPDVVQQASFRPVLLAIVSATDVNEENRSRAHTIYQFFLAVIRMGYAK